MSIYQDIILDHYHNPKNAGKLEVFDVTISLTNPLCGDEIEVFVKFDGDQIKAIGHITSGCAISQASASMISDKLIYMKKDDILLLGKEAVLEELGIELSPTRLKCALLSLEAFQKALKI